LKRDHVSFAELSRLPGFEGEYAMCPVEHPNIIWWPRMSEEAIEILGRLRKEGAFHFHLASPLTYLTDGCVVKFPLAKRNMQYATPHWLPVCLKTGPLPCSEDGCPGRETKRIKPVKRPKSFTARYTDAFAKLNGWSPTNEHFSFRQLAGRGRDRSDDDSPVWRSGADDPDHVLDHLFFFRRERKPAAIVTMPYHGGLEQAQRLAERYGLIALAPPIAAAGWWLPGSAECFVFVRQGTGVRWLPEQEDEAAYEKFAEEHAEDQRRRVEEYERQKAMYAAKQENSA
jgi:hypothetical protein